MTERKRERERERERERQRERERERERECFETLILVLFYHTKIFFLISRGNSFFIFHALRP